MSDAILYDATLCIGCKQCEEACARENGLPYTEAIASEEPTSDRKYTSVLTRDDGYMRRMCMHCLDPTCASVCPVGALKKTAAGPVVYREERCIGCRYCMLACPFGVPKYEWSRALPGVRKCTMCSDRLARGLVPACAEVCPTEATIAGDRDQLIEEARRRIRENPESYVPHIFGVNEVGGTSVLLLSGAPFEAFGYRTGYVDQSLPMLTYRVLSRIPDLTALGFVFLGGIWWITNRRMKLAAEARETPGHEAEARETQGQEAKAAGEEKP
jgi:formate dehydrogenase iron-sulfur subunit